uniref:Uncharacterized protein n=1 Tax=Arundo donax TaxID=35708 RepID=A0A0A9DBJ7_ARUDO
MIALNPTPPFFEQKQCGVRTLYRFQSCCTLCQSLPSFHHYIRKMYRQQESLQLRFLLRQYLAWNQYY